MSLKKISFIVIVILAILIPLIVFRYSMTKEVPHPQTDKVLLLMQNGQWQKVLPLLDEIHKDHPENVENLHRLGMTHEALGQLDLARMYYEMALKYDPQHKEANLKVANIYTRLGAMTEALKSFLKAFKDFPESPHIANNIGSIYAKNKEWGQAAKYYQMAVDLSPVGTPKAAIQTNLGYVSYQLALEAKKKQNIPEAIRWYDVAIKNIPDFHEAIKELGLLYMQEGNLLKALETFKKSDKLRRPDIISDTKNVEDKKESE